MIGLLDVYQSYANDARVCYKNIQLFVVSNVIWMLQIIAVKIESFAPNAVAFFSV